MPKNGISKTSRSRKDYDENRLDIRRFSCDDLFYHRKVITDNVHMNEALGTQLKDLWKQS